MKKNVDLGNGVFISWTTYENERVGGVLIHPKADAPNGECAGAFWFEDNRFNAKHPHQGKPFWKFNGDYEKPTLSPSFLCHCGFHGFIRDGKWITA